MLEKGGVISRSEMSVPPPLFAGSSYVCGDESSRMYPARFCFDAIVCHLYPCILSFVESFNMTEENYEARGDFASVREFNEKEVMRTRISRRVSLGIGSSESSEASIPLPRVAKVFMGEGM